MNILNPTERAVLREIANANTAGRALGLDGLARGVLDNLAEDRLVALDLDKALVVTPAGWAVLTEPLPFVPEMPAFTVKGKT